MKPTFDKVERIDAAEWQRGIEACDSWKRETVRIINDPEKFLAQQKLRVEAALAEYDREVTRLSEMTTTVENADAKLEEIQGRRDYHVAGLQMRLGFDRANKLRELYQQLKQMGLEPTFGENVSEDDIVS